MLDSWVSMRKESSIIVAFLRYVPEFGVSDTELRRRKVTCGAWFA